jgi:DNA-binding response OmpR family regulator
MRGDREKCIQAGASDYIAKPVDMDHLLSLLRVGLSRKQDRPVSPGPLEGEAE